MSDKLKQRRIAKGRARALPLDNGDSIEKQLAYVAEVSKNARTTWFGLIGLLLFCGVTLLDVQDRDFFEYSASTQLPLINVSVPTKNFFWAAPLLVTGLFTYLHLYLDKLWKALAPLDNEIDGKPVTQVVYPWLISDTALEMRAGVARGPYWFITRFVTFCLCWLVGPLTLFLFWTKSWAPHDEWLTTVIGLQLVWLVMVAVISWRCMCDEASEKGNLFSQLTRDWLIYFGILGAYAIFAIGFSQTENGQLGGIYPAQLYRASFVVQDKDWKGRDAAWRSYRRENRTKVTNELARENPPHVELDEKGIVDRLRNDFKQDRRETRAALNRLDYSREDLREAELNEAFLVGLDLRFARLGGASLIGARIEGANLRDAKADGAIFRLARLEEANLIRARLAAADLSFSRLEAADLRAARLEGADLAYARLEDAKLSSADVAGADFQYALVIGVDLTLVRNLTQEQVNSMYGDETTRWDRRSETDWRERPSHWPSVSIPREQRISCWKEWAISERAKLFWLPETDVKCTTHADSN